MIAIFDNYYLLSTKNTSYAFRVMETGHLEHLYYGSRIKADCKDDLIPLTEIRGCGPGNTCSYTGPDGKVKLPALTLEDVRLEMSSYGNGDIREPYIEIIHKDGSYSSDFLFYEAFVSVDKPIYTTLPTSYYTDSADSANDKDRVLTVTLKDVQNNIALEMIYCVFYETDIITRMTRLINTSGDDIRIKRIMSTQLDFAGTDYVLHTFTGAWAREMHHNSIKVPSAKVVNSSYAGTSSSRANPFVMIAKGSTTQDAGEVYGINLVYSGNHYEALEAGNYGKTRFVAGINPQSFDYKLAAGGIFEAPEAVMTFSSKGFNKMSHSMHDFVNNHIVRGKYKNAQRPILLNCWEALYFDINEEKLLELAKKAKNAGVELLVMDDGWFGKRNNDTSSLGDWYVNKDKLPNGIEGLCKKVNDMGLEFGIWVEPEMVNADSDLYRAHPEYAITIPGKTHSEGRNQIILDLTRQDVRDYIIESMEKVFCTGVSYVKWDMNRIFTDVYSRALPADRQGEVFHRYVMGFYEIMETLTKEFPDILFEGCSSGGNRFDLGMLSYFPQIWGSDDTDAYERVIIQDGYSYGYPQSAYTCHVSEVPNHQTRRVTSMETRFNVASFGNLGYECNLNRMSDDEVQSVAAQIKYYKKHRNELLYGDFYRNTNIPNDNVTNWSICAKDGNNAYGFIMQNRAVPNQSMNKTYIKGLDSDAKYEVTMVNLAMENDMDSNYKMTCYGDTLSKAGMFIKQGFAGTGENEYVMDYQDLGSKMFYAKKL